MKICEKSFVWNDNQKAAGTNMDIGKPLAEYGRVDITTLREKMLCLPKEFWEIDRASRIRLAGNRPGNAVFFYNDSPSCLPRQALNEYRSGVVSVLRYAGRPLFAEIQELIERSIKPQFPDCDFIRVQLAELPPGSIIEPHTDRHILTLVHRLHVPIMTHQRVKFIIDNQCFSLEEGKLYDLNNTVLHSVENSSNIMRVHLMIDMLPRSVAKTNYYDTEEAMLSAITSWLNSPAGRSCNSSMPSSNAARSSDAAMTRQPSG